MILSSKCVYEIRVKYGSIWQAKFVSEIIWGVTWPEPVAICARILGNDNDHFVQFWLNLNAACESCDGWVSLFAFFDTMTFDNWLFVQFIEIRIRDVNSALSTVDSCAVPVNWVLVRSHLVLFVSTFAVSMDTWDTVSLNHLEQAFAFKGSHSSWYTIGRDDINPDQLISHLDASTFYSWSQCCSSKPLRHA